MLSADQLVTDGVMLRKILKPICLLIRLTAEYVKYWIHPGNSIRCFPEIRTPRGPCFSEVVLDKAHSDIVSHFVKLFVDFCIVAVVVAAELGYYRSVGQGDKLGIDFIYTTSAAMVST